MNNQCSNCGGMGGRGHTCPPNIVPDPIITIDGKTYQASIHVIAVLQAVSEERDDYRKALEEIREVWAGSDGLVPETCPEGYLQRLLKQCYSIAVKCLK